MPRPAAIILNGLATKAFRIRKNVWVNINGATSTTLVYSSFEADSVASPVTFTIGSGIAAGDYTGKVYQVNLRLHAERTLNGNVCSADSSPVLIKKVTAVDP